MKDSLFPGDLGRVGFLTLLLAYVAVDFRGFTLQDLVPALPGIFQNECS